MDTILDVTVRELHESGLSIREIAKRVGIPKSTVHKRLDPLHRVKSNRSVTKCIEIYALTRTSPATGESEQVELFFKEATAQFCVDILSRYAPEWKWFYAIIPARRNAYVEVDARRCHQL